MVKPNRRLAANDAHNAKSGTGTPLFAVMEEEWQEQFAAMSFKIAAKFQTPFFSYEERQQIARQGILQASQTFENMPNNSRAYWAWRKGCHAVETAIRDEARRLKQSPQTLESDSYSEPTTSDNPLTALIEREEREARERVHEKKSRWLHSAIKKLPQNIREVVTRVALEGKSQVQVAKELNLSQGWVSRLYERGVEELRAQTGQR